MPDQLDAQNNIAPFNSAQREVLLAAITDFCKNNRQIENFKDAVGFAVLEEQCDLLLESDQNQSETLFASQRLNNLFMLEYLTRDMARQKQLFQNCSATASAAFINKFLQILATRNPLVIDKCIGLIINLFLLNEAQPASSLNTKKAQIIEPIIFLLLQESTLWKGTKMQPSIEWLLTDIYSRYAVFRLGFLEESLHLMIMAQLDAKLIDIVSKKLATDSLHNRLICWNYCSIWDECLNIFLLGSPQVGALAIYLSNCNYGENYVFTLVANLSDLSIGKRLAALAVDRRCHDALKATADHNNIFKYLSEDHCLCKELTTKPAEFFAILQCKKKLAMQGKNVFLTDEEIKNLCIAVVSNNKNVDFIIFVLHEILPYFNGTYKDLMNAVTANVMQMVDRDAYLSDLIVYLQNKNAGYLNEFAARWGVGSHEVMLLKKIQDKLTLKEDACKRVLHQYAAARAQSDLEFEPDVDVPVKPSQSRSRSGSSSPEGSSHSSGTLRSVSS